MAAVMSCENTLCLVIVMQIKFVVVVLPEYFCSFFIYRQSLYSGLSMFVPTRIILSTAWYARGGGYSIYPRVGRCGPAPHTLTLFKTKIADFPTLFKTEFRLLIPCLKRS